MKILIKIPKDIWEVMYKLIFSVDGWSSAQQSLRLLKRKKREKWGRRWNDPGLSHGKNHSKVKKSALICVLSKVTDGTDSSAWKGAQAHVALWNVVGLCKFMEETDLSGSGLGAFVIRRGENSDKPMPIEWSVLDRLKSLREGKCLKLESGFIVLRFKMSCYTEMEWYNTYQCFCPFLEARSLRFQPRGSGPPLMLWGRGPLAPTASEVASSPPASWLRAVSSQCLLPLSHGILPHLLLFQLSFSCKNTSHWIWAHPNPQCS